MQANRSLVRAGFVLFCLALLTGFAIPEFLNTKMALAAHLSGILNALVLIVLGLIWQLIALTPGQARLTGGLFLYAAFANWGGACLAAAWGTSRLTPLSGAGYSAQPWQETIAQTIQISQALAILTGAVLVVYGLRAAPGVTTDS